ncbi:MAG: heterodisulfide reductase-related iron-sulfur binding cluster [Dehalococcoidales bacterium]|nr:heterodisulfide reductase-related iron-sulfur binding cluster [Dehalococcoidales bacterium]
MTEASREVFWNISVSWPMYVVLALAMVVLCYGVYIHYKRWLVGQPANRANNWWQRTKDFLYLAVVEGLIHRKFLGIERPYRRRELFAGAMHFFIFWGFIVFLLATIVGIWEAYLTGPVYLAFSVIVDAFGILAVVGILMALFRRYIWKCKRIDNKWEDLSTLLIILVIIVSGFIVEGLRIAVSELPTHADWAVFSPGGWVFAKAFEGASPSALLNWHVGIWWFHVVLAYGLFAYLALVNSRLFHIVWDPVNIFFRNLGHKGALTPIDFEKTEQFGVSKIEEFTWKQLFDLDACTRCGRCQDACPAYASGKSLNPKQIIQDLKNHLYEVYPGKFSLKPAAERKEMLGGVITDEALWDCTTCRACMQACPIYVEHVDKIIDMRRNLAMEKSRFPEAAQEALKSLNTRFHPYRGTTATRTTWCEGLDISTVADAADIDVLYWVGCSAALDDRNMKVARATVKVLQAAGVKFAILGDEEVCCGDPARRIGDEYLFQTLCKQNIEILKGHNVKKILTSCPHCFNSFKFEYPQFGGNFEVVHHTQFLAGLLKDGKLKIKNPAALKTAYHDSCYLGRYNDVYSEPRQILHAVNSKNVELPRRLSDSFCCGGGGGHIWMEEDADKRVNERRVEEILKADVKCVATACPYCLTMLEDGIKAKNAEETVKAVDLSELLAAALE